MRKPWEAFSALQSETFVRDMMSEAQTIPAEDLVDLTIFNHEQRLAACGLDPISAVVAYAQNELIYDAQGRTIKAASHEIFTQTARENRVNIFGRAYKPDAKLWLHKNLATILSNAAIHLYRTQQWSMVVYDGLRTIEGGFALYNLASDEDLNSGLLATPGKSSHNKAMAVDYMLMDASGNEVDMGGHFDHLNMTTNSRAYTGGGISEVAKKNRIIREAAFLRAAFANGFLGAPLRSEFWHDQLPENREDLWRVLDSVARVMGIKLLGENELKLLRTNRKAFAETWETWSYEDFKNYWRELFEGMEEGLIRTIGVSAPPAQEKPEFYHGNYHPIYDRDLRASGKHQTD